MTQKFKFSEGEKVLCFHGPLIYEAKALKCSIKDKQIKYYIHYAGWNKNWDEWVPEDRVLKYNEANVERQKEVFKQHNTAAAAGKNKKATLKGKKGELSGSAQKDSGASSGGSESRASTPSKELNSSLVAPSTTSTSSGRGRGKQPAKDHETPSKKEEENGIAASASTSVATKLDEKDEPIKKKRISSTVSEKATSTTPTPAQAAAATAPAAATTASATTNIAAITTSALSDSDSTSTTTATSTSANTNASAAGGNPTARSTDPTLESEETFLAKLEVKIKIPDELKQCLADDWDAITRQHKLIDVPAKITVQDIVDQYVVFKKTGKNSSNNKELAVTDVMNGIVEYFNVMIGSQLLYKFERPQYAEILQQHPDTPLSKLYGGFHLLRLFVKLGTMLGYSALDEKSMQMLLTHLNDFLKFLVKNCATYFNMSNFVNVTPEYVRNTQ